MSHTNRFFFLRTLWGAMRHAEWQAAMARGGVFAVLAEFFRALLGFNAWPFFIPINGGWEPATIRPILATYGIDHWGWGKRGGEYFFQVRLRQANWAQYLLQQHGVPINGLLLDEAARSAYRPVARQSLRPIPGAANPSPHAIKPQAAQPDAPAPLFRDPVGQINRAVDRLAKW